MKHHLTYDIPNHAPKMSPTIPKQKEQILTKRPPSNKSRPTSWMFFLYNIARIRLFYCLLSLQTHWLYKTVVCDPFPRSWRVQGAPGGLLEPFPSILVSLRLHGAELWPKSLGGLSVYGSKPRTLIQNNM